MSINLPTSCDECHRRDEVCESTTFCLVVLDQMTASQEFEFLERAPEVF